VLNQTGLIGRVIAVGQNHARVILLSDGDSRVPVMGELTRARALVSGDKTAAPRLAHLNTPPLMRDGERVVTSGDDGIFPRGLAVGQAGIGPDKLWRVRLASGVSAIDFVRLIPPNAFVAPIDPVTQPSLPPPPRGELATQDVPPAGSLGGGGVLPLAAGATAVPVAATPEAIRAAQMELIRRNERQVQEARALAKKLEAERDAARQMARRLASDRPKADPPTKTTPPQTTGATPPSGNEPAPATSPPAAATIVIPPEPIANPPPAEEGGT
jgi:rod shape-determining protein MreC